MPGRSMIACIGLVARVTQNKKSIQKSEINLEIRNQLGNQKSTWKSEIKAYKSEIKSDIMVIGNLVRYFQRCHTPRLPLYYAKVLSTFLHIRITLWISGSRIKNDLCTPSDCIRSTCLILTVGYYS